MLASVSMAATEGRRTLFGKEILFAILSLVSFCVLLILSLGMHIKFNHWCSFTVSIFTYLTNICLFAFGLTIFSFYSRLVAVMTMFITIVFLFFFFTIVLFAIAGKIEG